MQRKPFLLLGTALLAMVGSLLVLAPSVAEELPFASTLAVPEHEAPTQKMKAKPVAKAKSAAATQKKSGYLSVVDHPEIREEHKEIADEMLRMLPTACRLQLQNFYVRYDHPEQRGLAGPHSVIVTGNVPPQEFRALLVHELFGHLVDLGCLQGTAESGVSSFHDGKTPIYINDLSVSFYEISWLTEKVQRAEAQATDFVTGYANWDAFEDFAETVTYYVLQEDAFRARAKTNETLAKKLAWLETNLFPKKIRIAEGTSTWDGKTVPWDATKLPYAWIGKSTQKL